MYVIRALAEVLLSVKHRIWFEDWYNVELKAVESG